MVLKAGEPAYHDTTGLFKLGDGVTALSALSFLPTVSASTPTIQQVLTAGQVATTTIETTGFIKTGGTFGEFLKADGSVDNNSYITLSNISASTPLNYSNLTGVFSMNQSSALSDGYLSSTDWSTFNGKTTLAAVNAQNLSVFAATTSSQLAGVISDETGTGALVFGTSPTFTTSIITPNVTGVSGVNGLTIITNNTASGAIARGVHHTPTLVAAANSDVLVGFDFVPTFTNGAFTGVANYAARFNGRVSQEGLGNSTFFGSGCGVKDDLTNNVNAGFGVNALLTNISGEKNCAFGYNSLRLSTASFNVAFGTEALQATTTGAQNVAIGNNSLYSNQTGAGNTAVGDLSLYQTTAGSNVGLGKNALYDLTSGNNNIAIGWNVGRGISTGTNNIIIGHNVTGLASALSNNILFATDNGVARFRYNPSQGSPSLFSFSPASTTGNVASTEINIFRVNTATTTLSTGALATQRFTYLPSQTLAFAGASTATNVYGLFVEAATAGTNATITNNYAAGFSGNVNVIGSLYSTGFILVDGTQGLNKVLVSDANGNASWATSSAGYARSFNNIAINTTGAAAANTDYYYFCTATLTFTLPTAVGNTNTYYIKVTSGTLTINTTSSQTIDGSLTIVTSVANTAFTLISDGTNWQII
jgi:hypothetical protein